MKSTGALVALLLCVIFIVPLWSQPAAAPFKPALLVIDIQNAYLPMMDQQDVTTGMEAINELIGVFRKHDYPVILVYHQEIGQPLAPGDPAFEFPASVKILESDPKVIKHHPSAFTKTNLDELLKAKGVNALYLSGLSATGCVLATYFGALDREYETVMVNEALISPKADYTTMIRNISGGWPLSLIALSMDIFSAQMESLESLSNEQWQKDFGITTPVMLNQMGYVMMLKQRMADAIVLLKANARLFPEEANCYDSLGEAYERNGQNDLALINYEKAYLKAKEKNDANLSIFEKNYQRLKQAKN